MPGLSSALPRTGRVTYTKCFPSLDAAAHLQVQVGGGPPWEGRAAQWLGASRVSLMGAGAAGRGAPGQECQVLGAPVSGEPVDLGGPLQLCHSETDSAGSRRARLPGEMLSAHLFWVWIFKELGVWHDISEVLGEGGVADQGFFFNR